MPELFVDCFIVIGLSRSSHMYPLSISAPSVIKFCAPTLARIMRIVSCVTTGA